MGEQEKNATTLAQATPEQTKTIRMVLNLTGVGFILGGAFCLFSPELMNDLLGFDAEIAQIFGGTLILVGIFDFVMARTIFKGKSRL